MFRYSPRRGLGVAAGLAAACRLAGALYDPVHHIESARLYGNIDQYAYWFVDLLVGSPAQRVSVILDTGSAVAGFPCTGCGHCGNHIDPTFDFGKSSSAKWIPCGGAKCPGSCRSGKCSYYQGYTEGSSIQGFYFEDWTRLGDAVQRNPAVFTKLGCHTNENNLFYTQKANGILGIGPNLRKSTLLADLFRDTAHVESRIFSLCLAEWGGRLVIGGHNHSYHRGPIKWVDLRVTGYYSVTVTRMTINGEEFQARGPWKSAIVDSGTTYTYMGRAPYNQLRNSIETFCNRGSRCGGARRVGKCWQLGSTGLQAFPQVTVWFGSESTQWHPAGYLFHKFSNNQWCYSFEDDGPGASTTLGASWMQHKEVIFDLPRSKMGIAEADCPEYRERPKHPGGVMPHGPWPTQPPPPSTARPRTSTTQPPPRTTSPRIPVPTAAVVPLTNAAPPVGRPSGDLGKGGGDPGKGSSLRATTLAPGITPFVAANATGSGVGTPPSGSNAMLLYAAGGAAAALLVLCTCCTVWLRSKRRKHHRLEEEEEQQGSLPADVVGAATGASPEMFSINGMSDGEDASEDIEGFEMWDDALQSPDGREGEESPALNVMRQM